MLCFHESVSVPTEVISSSGAKVTGICETPDMGPQNQTLIL